MIETERSRKQFVKQTGRDNLVLDKVTTNMDAYRSGQATLECPICAERRRKKAAAMKRYRSRRAK